MPAFVQQVGNTHDNAATLVLTLPGNATAGNMALVSFDYGNAQTVSSVAGLGATWTRVYQSTSDSLGEIKEMWKGVGCAGGSAAVTVTFSGNTYSMGHAAEFSGVNYIGAATGSVSSAVTTGTTAAQTLVTGDIAYALIAWTRAATTATYPSDSPGAWTSLTLVSQLGSDMGMRPAYRLAVGVESATRQISLSSAQDLTRASVLLAATAPAGAGIHPRPQVHSRAVTRAAVI